jgi:hypothetical protein
MLKNYGSPSKISEFSDLHAKNERISNQRAHVVQFPNQTLPAF